MNLVQWPQKYNHTVSSSVQNEGFYNELMFLLHFTNFVTRNVKKLLNVELVTYTSSIFQSNLKEAYFDD